MLAAARAAVGRNGVPGDLSWLSDADQRALDEEVARLDAARNGTFPDLHAHGRLPPGDEPYALSFGGTGSAFLSPDENEGRFYWDR